MSLVAYAASDDSDASDTEQTEDDNQSNNRIRPRPTANVPATENHATQNSVDHALTPGQISDSDSDTRDDSVLLRQEDEAPVYSLLKGGINTEMLFNSFDGHYVCSWPSLGHLVGGARVKRGTFL